MNGKCSEEEKLAGAILNEISEDEENEIVMQMICRVKNWQFVERTTLDEVKIRLNDEDIRMVKANKNRTFVFSNPSIFGFITKQNKNMLTETMTNKTIRMVLYVAKDGDIDSQLLIEKITEKVK